MSKPENISCHEHVDDILDGSMPYGSLNFFQYLF
jgi:hypothetical protein